MNLRFTVFQLVFNIFHPLFLSDSVSSSSRPQDVVLQGQQVASRVAGRGVGNYVANI